MESLITLQFGSYKILVYVSLYSAFCFLENAVDHLFLSYTIYYNNSPLYTGWFYTTLSYLLLKINTYKIIYYISIGAVASVGTGLACWRDVAAPIIFH